MLSTVHLFLKDALVWGTNNFWRLYKLVFMQEIFQLLFLWTYSWTEQITTFLWKFAETRQSFIKCHKFTPIIPCFALMPACRSFLLRTAFCDKITGLFKAMGYIKLLDLYFAATKTEKLLVLKELRNLVWSKHIFQGKILVFSSANGGWNIYSFSIKLEKGQL